METRRLSVDFALHADDDLDFKNELIGHLIRDLNELKEALVLSMRLSDMSHYRKARHKVNSTLTLLADEEFKKVVDEIKTGNIDPVLISQFNSISSQLIHSLEVERSSPK